MANNPETLNQLYEVLLYKKKDIIAIQKKLDISGVLKGPDNQMTNNEARRQKMLANSYELLLDLVEDIIPIRKELRIDGNPILEVKLGSNKASTDISYKEIFNLLMYLEEDIIAIQDELGIIDYSNQERAEEVDEKVRSYLQKLEEFHGPLEDEPSVILLKYGEIGIEKIRFTGEGLPLFPNLTSQQLHEIFVKNPASAGQCPCLEQVS